MFKWLKEYFQERARLVREEAEHTRLANDWMLVHVQDASYEWTINGKPAETDEIIYYLYENGIGQRKFEYTSEGYTKRHNKEKDHPIFKERVYPWSKGKDFLKIGTYQQAKMDKTAIALKR